MLRFPQIKRGASIAMGVALALAMGGFAVAQNNVQNNADMNRQSNAQRSNRSNDSASAQQNRQQSDRNRQSAQDQSRNDQNAQQGDRNTSDRDNRNNEDAGLGVAVTEANRNGVRVTYVFPNSPAEEMGIQRGDRITQVNGQQVESVRSFISEIRNSNPGDNIDLEIRRDGNQRELSGELESRRETLRQGDRGRQFTESRSRAFYGAPRESASYDRGQFDRSDSDLVSRLDSIERQLDRLSREVDNLRDRVENRQSTGSSEQTARFQDNQVRRDGRNYSARWSEEPYRSDTNRRGTYYGGREYQPGVNPHEESIGGDVGGARTEPGPDRMP
jgi:PDZ domain